METLNYSTKSVALYIKQSGAQSECVCLCLLSPDYRTEAELYCGMKGSFPRL